MRTPRATQFAVSARPVNAFTALAAPVIAAPVIAVTALAAVMLLLCIRIS